LHFSQKGPQRKTASESSGPSCEKAAPKSPQAFRSCKLKINYPLYNYYLQGNSLTRTDKDKYLVLSDTLRYWIDWIVDYFNSLKYPRFFKDSIKTYIINRIKYEATKSLELKLKYNHSNDDYSLYFDRLKTYKLNNLLN
jgi:hypothetical protein